MPQLDGAIANLLHLLDLPNPPRVGQFGKAGDALSSILTPVVGTLLDLGGPIDSASTSPLDLVVLWGEFDERAARMVRPGGWLAVIRDYQGRWARPHPFPPSRVLEVRRWLVSPGLHFPYAVVPLSHVAMRSHELATRGPGWKRAVRLTAILLGWPAREFTGEVIAVRLS